MNPWILGTIIYLCLFLLAFFFSGLETGYLSLNQEKLRHDSDEKKPAALLLSRLTGKPDMVLGMTLFGTNTVNVAFVFLGTLLFMKEETFFWYSALTTVIIFIFAEVLPKILFKKFPNKFMYLLSPLVFLSYTVLYLPVWLINQLANLVLYPVLRAGRRKKMTRTDFLHILDDSLEEGFLAEHEMRLFDAAASLSTVKAAEVMRPLVELTLLSDNQNISLKPQPADNAGDILPVFSGRIDNLIGYVDLLEVFSSSKKSKPVSDFLKQTLYVSENTGLDSIYSLFSRTGKKALIAVDEHGGCSGIIRDRDVLNYLFGEPSPARRASDGEWILQKNKRVFELDAAWDIDDVCRELKIKIPKEGFETLGGFAAGLFESIPEEGSSARWKNLRIRILKSSPTRIERVQLEIL